MSADAQFHGPVFIVGMPRSGTKLLRGLLNGHSRIGIPMAETEFLPDWERRWDGFGDLTDPERFRVFYDSVKSSAYFTYLKEEQGRDHRWQDWHARCEGGSLAEVFEGLLRMDAGVVDGGLWGDKSPGYIAHLGLIRKHFPEARIIHIVRDVRDYCMSIQKAWGKDPLRAAQRWVDRIEAIRDEDLLELHYEDLLEDPAAQLRRVCEWLSLEFESEMIQLEQAVENLGDTRGQIGIQTQNRHKYVEGMEPTLRRRIEALAGPTLERLGYPVETSAPARRLSPTRMAIGQLLDGIQLVRSDASQRGWIGAVRFRIRLFRETGRRERLR